MKTVVVASENPVKIGAVQAAFQRMYPDEVFGMQGVAAASGVSDQPMSEGETYRGAEQRARNAALDVSAAEYWVGIEGGIEDTDHGMVAFAWVVILSASGTGKGRTGSFVLPEPVAELVRQGQELGTANDLIFGRENTKQQEGAIGLLTDNVMDRAELYEHAVVLALAPIKSRHLYQRDVAEA